MKKTILFLILGFGLSINSYIFASKTQKPVIACDQYYLYQNQSYQFKFQGVVHNEDSYSIVGQNGINASAKIYKLGSGAEFYADAKSKDTPSGKLVLNLVATDRSFYLLVRDSEDRYSEKAAIYDCRNL